MIVNKELAKSTGCQQQDKWETPARIFDPIHAEFNITLDPCCEVHTAKAKKFYTIKEDGLIRSWRGETVFVNPPYSRGNIDKWVEKCFWESKWINTIVIALLPVSTSSDWFHKWVINQAELRFYRGRIRFVGAPFTAPFSSVLAIFKLK